MGLPTEFTDLAATVRNWGRWGPDDELGCLNYLDSSEVLRGIGEVKTGEVFTLQTQMGHPKGDPVFPGRKSMERENVLDESSWGPGKDDAPQFPGGVHYADDVAKIFLQGSSQYDALGHVWYDGEIWNGYDAKTTIGGLAKASVLAIAEKGVVERATSIVSSPLDVVVSRTVARAGMASPQARPVRSFPPIAQTTG